MRETGQGVQDFVGWPRFAQEALLPRQPAIYQWKATNSIETPWSHRYFKARYPLQEVVFGPFHEEQIHLANYLEQIESMVYEGADTSSMPYPRNIWLPKAFPDLVADICLPPFLDVNLFAHPLLKEALPVVWHPWIEIFFSPPGIVYPQVHVDRWMTHAWIMQVFGEKRIYLWPPRICGKKILQYTEENDDTRPKRLRDSQFLIEINAKTNLKNIFEHVAPIELHLKSNQIAFIPAGWWHTTKTLTPSISLSGNFMGPDNFEDFVAAVILDSTDATHDASDVISQCKKLRPYAYAKLHHMVNLLG